MRKAGSVIGRCLNQGLRPSSLQSYRSFFAIDPNTAVKAESFYDSTVEKYAQQPIEVLSLHKILNFGKDAWQDSTKVLKSARHAQRELPKRLARRLLDLQLLPFIVVTNPHIKKVYQSYYTAFETLRQLPPVSSLEENANFTALLRKMLDEHAPMLDLLAAGLRECKSKELVGSCLALDPFFDNMLRSRISRRTIAEQHLHLSMRRPGYIGIVCTDLDVADSIQFAIQRTKQVCNETYGLAPDVKVSGDSGAKLPYIPAHLDYILYEILKNAMRAVVELHRPRSAALLPHASHAPRHHSDLPAVQVRICAGVSDLTVRITDQGGGIPADQLEKVWSYGYTTIKSGSASSSSGSSGSSGGSAKDGVNTRSHSADMWNVADWSLPAAGPSGVRNFRMAGLGFGLPLSRLYARYFGGELTLQVMPGYGTDVYITLKRLEEQQWQESPDQLPHLLPFKFSY